MQEKNMLSRRRFLLAAGATGLTLGLAAYDCTPSAAALPVITQVIQFFFV